MAARQQVQRIRCLDYNHRHKRNLKQLQEERDTLTPQLDHARHTCPAYTLQRELNRLKDAYGRNQETMTQLHQTNTVLIRFCHTKLQQRSAAIHGLEAQLGRRVGGNPQQAPRNFQPRGRQRNEF